MHMHGILRKEGVAQSTPPPPSDDTSLNVALYPYVPNPMAFQQAVTDLWARSQPSVSLIFVDWDCYVSDPPPTLDVFAFDCVFGAWFASQNLVMPIPSSSMPGLDDLQPFAMVAAATTPDNSWFCGIPYYGCLSVLYYREGDDALSAPSMSLQDVCNVIGPSPQPGEPVPPMDASLLVEFSGGTTDACLYLQAFLEPSGPFPFAPPLPTTLEPGGIDPLKSLATCAGEAQAAYVDAGHDRTTWFTGGRGRALVGFTESMSGFPCEVLPSLRFRPLPLGPANAPVPFYADAVGINPNLGARTELALELASVISSTATFMLATEYSGPQYLTPARVSTLDQLGGQFAEYAAIQQMLAGCNGEAFRMGPQARPWLDQWKAQIKSAILGTPPTEIDPALVSATHRRTPGGLWRRL